MSRSTWSTMPCLVSQLAQSSAWIFECFNRTTTSFRGQARRRAYMARVIEVQLASAASNRSYGLGPGTAATHLDRFVGDQAVSPGFNLLRKPAGTAANGDRALVSCRFRIG